MFKNTTTNSSINKQIQTAHWLMARNSQLFEKFLSQTLTTLSTPGTPVRPPVMTIKCSRCPEIPVVNQYELENNFAIIHRSTGNPHERPAALPVRN